MEDVLQHLPSTTDRIAFLKKRGCLNEAARALEDDGRRDEAARLLRDAGRFEEAVKYSNDPKFAADCLMAQVRTTMETEDTAEILQRSLEKYQHCGDTNGQAEASLMLGKLNKDFQKLQKAGKLFDKCKNCCGEAESVAELLVTTSYEPPKNYGQWIPVRSLERLLRLVTLLYRPAAELTLAEQNEITKCEEHFGLFKTDAAHKKRFFRKCGGRFAMVDPEFVKSNTSNTEAMIDTAQARQNIGRFLINFSVNLVTKIRTMLETTLSKSSMCRKVAEGTLCDNASCVYQHQDSGEHFSNRFYALFHFMYLESVVELFTMEMISNQQRQDASPLELKDFREFRMCQRFYKFLFPTSGNREFHLTLQHVRNLRITKAVNKRILQFADVSWRQIAEEKRRSDTDNFLKVSSCLQLIGSDPLMVRWICEEEKDFLKKARNPTFRPTNDQLAKNGMVGPSPKTGSGGHHYESYLQWWEDGKRRLYVHGDVKNAVHLIIKRFLTLTAKRSRMIYPSIANTVMILEHQLTACLALYSRLCIEYRYPEHRCSVCLPASYLTMVRFWDTFRPGVEKGTFTLYEAVERNVIQEPNKGKLFRDVCSLLNYMVELTCGEVASSFDVLGDALNSESTPDYCASGEAERTLVLFLTMLCNCGKGISSSLDAVMLTKIFKIDPNSHLASRINNVLEEIKKAKGFCDVVLILKTFLQSREEKLYDLRWQNGKLRYDEPCNPASYPKSFQTDVSSIWEELQRDHQQGVSFRDTETETADGERNADDLDAGGEGMDVEHTEEELKEKEKVRLEVIVTAMQKLYRKKKFIEKIILLARVLRQRKLRRLESIEEQTRSSSNVLKEHFSQFKVDSSGCGICGTNFKLVATDDSLAMSHEDNEGISCDFWLFLLSKKQNIVLFTESVLH